MMTFGQKVVAAWVIVMLNAVVWGTAVVFGGLFMIAVAVMFSMFSGGAGLRIVAMG